MEYTEEAKKEYIRLAGSGKDGSTQVGWSYDLGYKWSKFYKVKENADGLPFTLSKLVLNLPHYKIHHISTCELYLSLTKVSLKMHTGKAFHQSADKRS